MLLYIFSHIFASKNNIAFGAETTLHYFERSFFIKGALDNIFKFSFWVSFIYHVKMIGNLQIQKEKNKNSF